MNSNLFIVSLVFAFFAILIAARRDFFSPQPTSVLRNKIKTYSPSPTYYLRGDGVDGVDNIVNQEPVVQLISTSTSNIDKSASTSNIDKSASTSNIDKSASTSTSNIDKSASKSTSKSTSNEDLEKNNSALIFKSLSECYKYYVTNLEPRLKIPLSSHLDYWTAGLSDEDKIIEKIKMCNNFLLHN